jgi:hypothetical protein
MIKNQKPSFKNGKILIQMLNTTTDQKENIELIPFGKTILRQVTFKN